MSDLCLTDSDFERDFCLGVSEEFGSDFWLDLSVVNDAFCFDTSDLEIDVWLDTSHFDKTDAVSYTHLTLPTILLV